MTPYHHALSSVKQFGGTPCEYVEIHNWFDETKVHTGDWTHRALRHHSLGIEECIKVFGHCIFNSDGKAVPTKLIAERHVIEDCGFIPTPKDYLNSLKLSPEPWMLKVKTKHKELES